MGTLTPVLPNALVGKTISPAGLLAGFYVARFAWPSTPDTAGLTAAAVTVGLVLPFLLRRYLPGEGVLIVALLVLFGASFAI